MSRGQLVVSLSGGLDSSTLAHKLSSEDWDLLCISFDYGQRHKRELVAAERIARRLEAPWLTVELPILGGLPSALTTPEVDVPDGHYTAESMKATVVPGRNLLMLATLASIAQAWNADGIAVAVHAGDHAIYPDCRPEFIVAVNAAVQAASEKQVRVYAPYLESTKTDIARDAGRLAVPIDETWSCYKGGGHHCGRCGTCVERIEALHDAGVVDPTIYDDPDFWRAEVAAAKGASS